MHHVFKLNEEDYGTVQKIDNSITSWSLELGRLELRLETAKAQLFGNYEARQSLLRKAVEEAGFDLNKVEDIKTGQGGQVLVIMADLQKQPSDGPSVDGVQTGPKEKSGEPSVSGT